MNNNPSQEPKHIKQILDEGVLGVTGDDRDVSATDRASEVAGLEEEIEVATDSLREGHELSPDYLDNLKDAHLNAKSENDNG